jgi:hypothetical protein
MDPKLIEQPIQAEIPPNQPKILSMSTPNNNINAVNNKKTKIALIFGFVSITQWIFFFIISSTYNLSLLPFIGFVLAIGFILAILGIIYAVLGFKTKKIKSVIAIIICIFGLIPLLIWTTMKINYSLDSYAPIENYSTSDFDIKLPAGWARADSHSPVQSPQLRGFFLQIDNKEVFQPRIYILSASGLNYEESLSTFRAKVQKDAGKILSDENLNVDNNEGNVIDYMLNENGNNYRGKRLTIKKDNTIYIVDATSKGTSWEKYEDDFTNSLLSFRPH